MPILPAALTDSGAGANHGLLRGPRTRVFLPFTEPAGVDPSDLAGSLDDLRLDTGLAAPGRAADPTWTGRGLTFTAADLQGLVAADLSDGDSLLQRDATIQVLLVFDATNATGPATIICRGLGSSLAEYYGWGLEIEESAGVVEIRWLWQTTAGTVATVGAGTYQHPGDAAELLITATRRWVSTTEVVCRYYVGAQLVAEVTSTDGSISGGTTGHTSVGARKFGGSWVAPFSGTIDQIAVSDYEMSGEEVRATWERMTVHQPNGVVALRALEPPGAPWSRDPSSDIGRLLTATGQAVGLAAARAEELRQNWLPHRAYADNIGEWERLVGLPQDARVSLDARRLRVVAQLSRDNGYAPAQIRQALSGPLGLAAADVEIDEFGPTWSDGFATLEAERWHVEPAAAAWSIAAGALQVSRALGDDLRAVPEYWSPCHVRASVDSHVDLVVQVKLATFWAALPANTIVGLFLYNRRSNDALWFGVANDGGTRKVGWRQYKAGVLSALNVLSSPATDAAHYLRIRKLSATGAAFYELQWSTVSFDASTGSVQTISTGLTEPEHVGAAAMSTDAALGAALVATFDDFLTRAPRSRRGFYWYAFRDPGLPGSADLLGANATVKTIKPAHTHAYAIRSRSLLCDDDASVCDGGPLGGL
jgi:hypothetical protein